VPTVEEAGLPLMRMDSWYGVFAPSRIPAPALDRLRAALEVVVADASFHKRLEVGGMEAMPMSPRQTDAFLKSEYTKWTGFIKEQGISGD
jgi:tripartite-type tricarboxylate transporter receptor subunit TctC